MSEVYPIVYPIDETIHNAVPYKLGDYVRVIDPQFDIERYEIVDVVGSSDSIQYAVRGLQTMARFAYFGPEDLKKA